jgi:hypothetical protein
VRETKARLDSAFKIAANARAKVSDKVRARNVANPSNTFGPGDLVWVYDATTKIHHSRKFTYRWNGPFVILSALGSNVYEIGDFAGTPLGRQNAYNIRHATDPEVRPLFAPLPQPQQTLQGGQVLQYELL